ncbi:hypothetical protein HRI_004465500 [Hibiscus trionum]|uniref:Uncharacterized protein n=1 Tax=Hibiscus trionum TaxID=183268 RepID=A0A9W7J7X0_HIBTR|nr:hypothetical protein HRI_004465500 [Hibiscus trionum]
MLIPDSDHILNERSDSSKMDSQFGFDNGVDNPPTSVLFGPNFMASKLYQLSPLEDLTLAITLVGHVGIFNDEVTNEKHGLVHRVYILCGKDNALEETSKSG